MCIIFLVSYRTKPTPEIESIDPPVGSPGDILVINGKNFGNSRDMSYVEFSGSKLTASAYLSWSDTCIRLVLPANIQDGLVVVGTKDMRSKPALFANEIDIPVPVTIVQQSSNPVITALSSNRVSVGEVITITGNNFGDTRNQSKVLFSIDYNNTIRKAELKTKSLLTQNMIPVSEYENGYIYWSNTEIKVRVPDGSCSGMVLVDTGKEKSEPMDISIIETIGSKSFSSKKIYVIQYTADVSDVAATDDSTITLRCPAPYTISYQPNVEITDVTPAPSLQNYQHCLIHQITKKRNNLPKSVFSQTFVMPVYEVKTSINVNKVQNYKSMDSDLYNRYTQADKFIPAENEEIVKLAGEIVGKEKNAYRKANLIYSYLTENFTVLSRNRLDDANPIDLINDKSGDAFDFAVVCTALLRAAGIPAVTDCGILISQSLKSQAHWWCEFYLNGFGWVPLDPALGAGMEYEAWFESEDRNYYFGNMDSHRILFSRGWNELKPFTQDNKTVQYAKSFALQTIWEESSRNTAKYSSYWTVPVVKGLY
ncbi:MAG: IPT/TIG domain-containing protein [Treponema sp.]|nr:IPT/TIG domain-containing protein [Treponema sp.]